MADTITRHDMTIEGSGFSFHFDTTGDVTGPLLSYDNTTGSKLYIRSIWLACGTNQSVALKEGSAGDTICSLTPDSSSTYRWASLDRRKNPIELSDGTSLALVALDGHVTGDIEGYYSV